MKDYLIHLFFSYRFRWLFLLPFTLVGHTFYVFANVPDHKAQALVLQKKEEVVRLYGRKRYAQANVQIELLLPLLRDRTDRSKFELYQAYCNFYEKKYLVSANQFYLFVKQYPAFPEVEEAFFMRGYSLAAENVDIRLDQTTTYDAIRCLKRYLAVYPTGAYVDKVSEALENLERRLMEKDFQAAALYVRLKYYKAAIMALKNFEERYPDSFLKEKIVGLLVKCCKGLFMGSCDQEKKKELIGGWQVQDFLRSKRTNIVEQIEKNKRSKESKENESCWITNLF